eukprot:scaffold107113_cov15-Tisochrysis_lutea.AAC.1
MKGCSDRQMQEAARTASMAAIVPPGVLAREVTDYTVSYRGKRPSMKKVSDCRPVGVHVFHTAAVVYCLCGAQPFSRGIVLALHSHARSFPVRGLAYSWLVGGGCKHTACVGWCYRASSSCLLVVLQA